MALRVHEVALRLGVDDETVRRALVRGELAGRKLGSTWLVPVKALEAWLLSTHEETPDGRRKRVSAGQRRRVDRAVVKRASRPSVVPVPLGQHERGSAAKTRGDESRPAGGTGSVEAEPWRLPPTVAR
ncbi:MAG: helix-turn-helix domain-containing protein [Candidatus Limnocylindrales bacterium]